MSEVDELVRRAMDLSPPKRDLIAEAMRNVEEQEQARFQVRDIVAPKPGVTLRSGCFAYDKAIVLNPEGPFALVSLEGDMLWTCTIKPEDVTKVGEATPDQIAKVKHRWPR